MAIKSIIKRIPVVGSLARAVKQMFHPDQEANAPRRAFTQSHTYWEERYALGGNSGVGSYDKFATFKADFLNRFIAHHNIASVMEFGCGDGNQLSLALYPSYMGYDVSPTAVKLCKQRFLDDSAKQFALLSAYDGRVADLVLSLDVIYHLVEDDTFDTYMRIVFGAAKHFVIIYSSDRDDNEDYAGTHVRHRQFTQWIEKNLPQWRLIERIPNEYPYRGDYREGSWSDFFVYTSEKVATNLCTS